MNNHDNIPRKDEEFHLFQESLMVTLPGMLPKPGITMAQLEPLVATQSHPGLRFQISNPPSAI
ncbi:MAG: hypothetical protein LBK99_17475 [Opitutaceae bacterium]|jgi:hypothetical protein|nr:hypothetical protein [Opitutaceae bacterium]